MRLASRFGRYGYRRVTDMLRIKGVMDRLAKFAQRRPGPRPRRHIHASAPSRLAAFAQRRPGPRSRRHNKARPVVSNGPPRSTKAGAETPATPLARGGDILEVVVRSTKAGAETPATRLQTGEHGLHRGRSTKAGAETPATPRLADPRRASSTTLNEGRGRDPGDTTSNSRSSSPSQRSTKAGAETPATRERTEIGGTGFDPRSTKAGAETPATRVVN